MSGLSVLEGNFGEPKVLAFAQAMGFKVVQILGQRIFGGPPPNWIGRPPTRKCEVFVGRLPRDCFEDEIVPVLCSVGPIYEMRLMMAHIGGTRGFAFVKYTNENDANNAVDELNGYEIRPGMLIGVMKSLNKCQLFVGEFPENFNKQQIIKDIRYHTNGIMYIKFKCSQSWISDERKCFYLIIEYETHREAALARRKLRACSSSLWNMTFKVKWLKDPNEKDFRTYAEEAESLLSSSEDREEKRNVFKEEPKLINGKTLEDLLDDQLKNLFISDEAPVWNGISTAGTGLNALESGSMDSDGHSSLSFENACNEGCIDSPSQLNPLSDHDLPSDVHDFDGSQLKRNNCDGSVNNALSFLDRNTFLSSNSLAAQENFSVGENNSAEKYSFEQAKADMVDKCTSDNVNQSSQVDFDLDEIILNYNNNNLELREILFKKNCDDSVSYSL